MDKSKTYALINFLMRL